MSGSPYIFDVGPPYIEIDGVAFPLVEGSKVQRSPLNPFSPAIQAGNSARITDARLAVQVWDNFTGGLGQRDEEGQQNTSYAEGNIDVRVPGAAALPPLATLVVNTGFSHTNDSEIFVEYMRHATTPGLFMWSRRSSVSKTWRNNVLTTHPAGNVRGFASFSGAYWHVVNTGGNSYLNKTVDAGGTWTTSKTWTGKSLRGLVSFDNRLIVYNETDNTFEYSTDGTTWAQYSGGPEFRPLETVSELFVWAAPGGARDTVFALTTQRIFGYEEEALEWHTFYDFEGVFNTDYPTIHLWRRDSNLYMAPFSEPHITGVPRDKNGIVMMFTAGVADETGPTKRFGLPSTFVDGIFRLQGGIHWLYGFAHGAPGGVFAFNEFGGWTTIFDPRVVTGSSTAHIIGGGYANGTGWAITDDGSLYSLDLPDRKELPPRPDGATYATGEHYLRSSWITHAQVNRWKIGAYFEIDMRRGDGTSGVPPGSVVSFHYRVDSGPWQDITLGNAPTNDYFMLLGLPSVEASSVQWPLKVPLPLNEQQTGIAYRRIQWEVRMSRSAPATDTPVLASVALYYTFWTGNFYAYQFALDLSVARFEAQWPDGMFGPYSRQELVEILLGFNEGKQYHTFTWASGPMEETIAAVDILVAGREDADTGGGVYSVTVRDLTAGT